mmetsp:Transcript_7967/g.49210  ORF Transcript_7967/g.49210 Transcript_7967/m.49210 type:complete len:90 (-) Transcript_7967:1281-1550(-)
MLWGTRAIVPYTRPHSKLAESQPTTPLQGHIPLLGYLDVESLSLLKNFACKPNPNGGKATAQRIHDLGGPWCAMQGEYIQCHGMPSSLP